jgi:hypothetical protein
MTGAVGKHQRALLPLVVALVAAMQTSYLVRLSVRQLAERGIGIDDTYFYAVLAQNFERLGYLTFNGSMPTNGVQPLWQWLLIGLHQLLPNVEVMQLCFGGCWLAYVGFCWLLVRHVVRLPAVSPLLGSALVAVLVVCNPSYQRIILNGLEPALFLFCFAAWLNLVQRLAAAWPVGVLRQTGMAILLGGLGALCFLARTDWFWLVPVGALFVWKQRGRIGLVVALLAAAALAVIPYLIHNWFSHGHLMPISGRVKLELLQQFAPTVADYLRTDEWQGAFSMLAGMFLMDHVWLGVVLAAALTVVAVRRRRQLAPSVRWMLLLALCHAVFMHLVYREVRPYTRYYFAVEGVAAAYLLMDLGNRVHEVWQRRVSWSPERFEIASVAALSVVVVLSWALTSLKPRAGWVRRIRMAQELQALDPDAKIAAYWPGAFAYFSGRPVFPLDGIIGSTWYLDNVVRRQRELAYALQQGIDHIVIHDLPVSALQSPKAPEVKGWSHVGKLTLWQQCQHVGQLVSAHVDPATSSGWYLYRLSRTGDGQYCNALRTAR